MGEPGSPRGSVYPAITIPAGARVRVWDEQGVKQPYTIQITDHTMAKFELPVPGRRFAVIAGPRYAILAMAYAGTARGGVEFMPVGKNALRANAWCDEYTAPRQVRQAALEAVAAIVL